MKSTAEVTTVEEVLKEYHRVVDGPLEVTTFDLMESYIMEHCSVHHFAKFASRAAYRVVGEHLYEHDAEIV